jgi:hypothetical protein
MGRCAPRAQVWVVTDAVRGMGGPEEAAALAEMAGLPGVVLLSAEQVIWAAAAWTQVGNMLALTAEADTDEGAGTCAGEGEVEGVEAEAGEAAAALGAASAQRPRAAT